MDRILGKILSWGVLLVLAGTLIYAQDQWVLQSRPSKQDEQRASENQNCTEDQSAVSADQIPTYHQSCPRKDQENWGEKWWRHWGRGFFNKVAITDALLAMFTGLLVFVGMRQEWWTKKHERAYIYGGIGNFNIITTDEIPRAVGVITMANYGRTPGFIEEIRVGSCAIRDLPDDPSFNEDFVQRFIISDLWATGPDNTETLNFRRTLAQWRCNIDGRSVVFQRVFFKDVFGKSHHSGSIYRFFRRDSGLVAHEPYVGKPVYWQQK